MSPSDPPVAAPTPHDERGLSLSIQNDPLAVSDLLADGLKRRELLEGVIADIRRALGPDALDVLLLNLPKYVADRIPALAAHQERTEPTLPRVAAPTPPNNSEAPRRYVQDALEGRPVGTVVGNSYRVAAPTPETPSRVREVLEQMQAFARTKPSPQQTRQKSAREMVELFAHKLEQALAGAVSHPQPDPSTALRQLAIAFLAAAEDYRVASTSMSANNECEMRMLHARKALKDALAHPVVSPRTET